MNMYVQTAIHAYFHNINDGQGSFDSFVPKHHWSVDSREIKNTDFCKLIHSTSEQETLSVPLAETETVCHHRPSNSAFSLNLSFVLRTGSTCYKCGSTSDSTERQCQSRGVPGDMINI